MITIPLSQGKSALIDDADFPLVQGYSWWALRAKNGRWYAVTRCNGVFIYMHRLLCETDEDVDHEDRDGLNNRRTNLRPASRSLNNGNQTKNKRNRSGFKGVHYCVFTGRWRAAVQFGGRLVFRERFDKLADAAHAYRAMAILTFGEFARV